MSAAQHTPGPWRVGASGPNGCATVGTEHGLMVAMVAHSLKEPKQKEAAIADAALIAAAPELLAALKRYVSHCDGFAEQMAQAAIKKATKEIA